MPFVTYCDSVTPEHARVGWLTDDVVMPLRDAKPSNSLKHLLHQTEGDLSVLVPDERQWIPLEAVRFRPVIERPGKIFCIGLNYHAHRIETGNQERDHPTVFARFADCLVGHNEAVWRPKVSQKMDFEGELAVIIGRSGRHVAVEDAMQLVAGYSAFNDISIRDWQRHTTQFTPGKNFERTGAFGPALVTTAELPDPTALTLTTRLNGETMQHTTTDLMIFSIPELIAYVTTFTRLAPGDVIVTGTPGGVGVKREPPIFMKAGDVVEVDITDVGCLRSHVVDEPEA
ncbi:MAG: fumarylacetoacetate hydrolase family protein [Pseudomonadota bacterium]